MASKREIRAGDVKAGQYVWEIGSDVVAVARVVVENDRITIYGTEGRILRLDIDTVVEVS